MRLWKHGKKHSIAFINWFSKIRATLKGHNCVYMLSSKHTYRPMRGRVVAQLFYKRELRWKVRELFPHIGLILHLKLFYTFALDLHYRYFLTLHWSSLSDAILGDPDAVSLDGRKYIRHRLKRRKFTSICSINFHLPQLTAPGSPIMARRHKEVLQQHCQIMDL